VVHISPQLIVLRRPICRLFNIHDIDSWKAYYNYTNRLAVIDYLLNLPDSNGRQSNHRYMTKIFSKQGRNVFFDHLEVLRWHCKICNSGVVVYDTCLCF